MPFLLTDSCDLVMVWGYTAGALCPLTHGGLSPGSCHDLWRLLLGQALHSLVCTQLREELRENDPNQSWSFDFQTKLRTMSSLELSLASLQSFTDLNFGLFLSHRPLFSPLWAKVQTGSHTTSASTSIAGPCSGHVRPPTPSMSTG